MRFYTFAKLAKMAEGWVEECINVIFNFTFYLQYTATTANGHSGRIVQRTVAMELECEEELVPIRNLNMVAIPVRETIMNWTIATFSLVQVSDHLLFVIPLGPGAAEQGGGARGTIAP